MPATNQTPAGIAPFPVSEGGTGISTTTAYGVMCGGTTSTGILQNVGSLGSSGQVLTSQGASALPQWVNGNSFVLIATKTASNSASIAFTTGITSTYNNYLLVLSSVLTATNSTTLLVQISTNGGSSYLSSGYSSGVNSSAANSATLANGYSTSGLLIVPSAANGSGAQTSCNAWLNALTSGSGYPYVITNCFGNNGSGYTMGFGGGSYNTGSTTVNAIQIIAGSGNISSGTFSLYGITH